MGRQKTKMTIPPQEKISRRVPMKDGKSLFNPT